MRTFLIGIVLVGIVAALLALRKPEPVTKQPPFSPTPTLSPSPAPPGQSMKIDHNGKTYRVAWLSVPDPSALTLIPNFSEKRTARSLIDSNQCAQVVSGGFYTPDRQPTGLFITERKTLRDNVPNTLLNGYVVVDQDNTASILASPPERSVRLSLQTGPILIRNGKSVNLAVRDDEFARRIVLGISQNGAVVFLAIYDPDNPWIGPKLSDTPAFVAKVTTRLDLRDVLNLDGGSASAFIRGDLSLQEFTSVGSFFCIK